MVVNKRLVEDDENVLARKVFVTLVKLYPRGYSILNDGYFVKKIYAASDDEAIRQFNELATKGQLLTESAKKIVKEQVVETKHETLVESVMSDLDLEVKEAGGKEAWIANVDEQIDDLSHYLNYLKKSAYNEVNRGGNFESTDEVDEAVRNCEKQLGLLKSKKQIVEERKDESVNIAEGWKDFAFIVKCNDGPKELVRVVAENKSKAEGYAKDMYAANHTTYADDRHNEWSVEEVNYLNEALYGMNQIEQFVKMADAIGLKTMGDFKDFMDREGQGKDVITALYDYLHDEIGDLEFHAKDESLKEDLTVAVNGEEAPVDVVDAPVAEPVVVEVDAEKQPIEELQEKISIEQVLSDLIKDEFEAIDGYSSSLATLKILENDGSDYSGIIANLEDIKNEELIHVGQLQKCLAEVNPKAEAIDDGKEEASETIAVAEEESAKGEEPVVEA